MRVIRDSNAGVVASSIATIGAFDGIHLGHQHLITQVVDHARAASVASESHIDSCVVTFNVHPATVVRPGSAPAMLTTLERKLELIEALGVDVVFVIEFDEERSATSARSFVEDVFVQRLGVCEVLVGSDFHFGKGREGTVEALTTMGDELGFVVQGVELLAADGVDVPHISSTAIRIALAEGRIADASTMLGRDFEVRQTVDRGDQRGRTIGFPTANMILDKTMARPANGVYAAVYEMVDGVEYHAAVNIGVRPTFTDVQTVVLEAHILDFKGDLYGSVGRVRCKQWLRGEKRFGGIDELKQQLAADVAQTRAFFR